MTQVPVFSLFFFWLFVCLFVFLHFFFIQTIALKPKLAIRLIVEHCKSLEVLFMSCSNSEKSRVSDTAISLLGGLSNLKELSLASKDASLRSVTHVALAHPTLTSLNLSESRKIETIILDTPLLQSLNLTGCKDLKLLTLQPHAPLVIQAGSLKSKITSILGSQHPQVAIR